jgi:cell wall-associated NlpC family hydrolase
MRAHLAVACFGLLASACSMLHVANPPPPAVRDRQPAPAIEEDSTGRTPQALMVASAMAMLGQPYRYGGAAPGGFDCSGLVAYAAGSAGIRVPRTTDEQLRIGAPVARGELRAGDLVFMHLRAKQLHVGIAVDPTHFVHAPATGKRVRIDSLDAAPYARNYVAARRVAGAQSTTSARPAKVEWPPGSSAQSLVSR